MAINILLDKILISLKEENFIGSGITDSIFEIGEQNWFGDISAISYLIQLINKYTNPKDIKKILADYKIIKENYKKNSNIYFDIAKLYYKILFNYKTYKSVDLHGTNMSVKKDLNYPYSDDLKYDVITNFGTTEHIFNQYEVYNSIHKLVKPNGLIMHFLPYQGAYNHGFYNFNPTFFFDLGKANDYKIIGLWIATFIDSTPKIFNIHNIQGYNNFLKNNIHPKECYIFVLYKSSIDHIKKFSIPQQSIYFDKEFSKESLANWERYKAPTP